ncbi:T Cell Receptor Delta Constant [Manis pentadactyla]|nr:T Cell Receptor Delta Constant [Manis pentadactyla]
MLWTCPLFYLTIFCTGVSLDIILEPDAKILTVVLGETATFRCSITGGHSESYRSSCKQGKSERISRDSDNFKFYPQLSLWHQIFTVKSAIPGEKKLKYVTEKVLTRRRTQQRASWEAELCLSAAMQRICSLIPLTLFWAGVTSAFVLVPQDEAVTVPVGESVTLRCTMEGAAITSYYMNWYRKTQVNTLTFIFRDGGTYGPGFQHRFRERQPPAKPSVFIMKNGTNVACLVKDFYPKDVNININSSKKIIEFDPAVVVSPSGKYNAVKLGRYEDPNSVTCSVQHNNEILHSTDFEPKTNSSSKLKPKEPESTKQTSGICREPKVHAEKVNMLSLSVLGFRMLFAKSVAINFLLTAKLFFF